MSGALQAVFQNQRSFGAAPGSCSFTTAGTYSFVIPAGVTSVSVVVVGAGGARGANAGGLAYRNTISVTPGNSHSIVVGAGGTGIPSGFNADTSATNSSAFCAIATAGKGSTTVGTPSGTYTGGGNGGRYSGGAGGYAGNGGAGATSGGSPGNAGAGGGGGGGGVSNSFGGAGGGGVGILGQGCSGAGGAGSGGSFSLIAGRGGSGGGNGSACSSGGQYGGGGASDGAPRCGTGGAVRILWPGNTRLFPSTCAGSP